MRLFTGIAIAPAVAEKLDTTLGRLRPLAPIKWVPAENFHITSLFIGAWPEQRLNELTRALEAMPAPAPFEIAIAGLRFFPNRKVLSAGVRAPRAIGELLWNIERAVALLGIAPDEKDAYSPHLTVARIGKENIGELRKEVAAMADVNFGTFKTAEFHLFLSKPGPGGPVYSRLASFPLGRLA